MIRQVIGKGANDGDDNGKHSEEAAEDRGVWFRWHNGAEVGSTPGFRGKARKDPNRDVKDG